MMHSFGWGMGGFGPAAPFAFFGVLMFAGIIWSLAWKAWSLWLAARRGEKIWFGLLLIANTFGILDIIYIFLVAKKSDKKEASPAPKAEAPKHEETPASH
jgi:hypothetical protein